MSDTYKRSILGWFRHRTDSYDTQKNVDKTSDSAKKRAKVGKRGSLTAVDRLSDSMPSLALRSSTSNQRPQTDICTGHQKSQSLSIPTSGLTGCKRSVSARSHGTPSGRNRWSSYELVGAAALSATAEVDDDASEPATAAVDNGPAIGRTVSAEALTADRRCSKGTPHKTDSDSPTTINSTPKERDSSQDELLERLRLVDDQIESCQTKRKRLLATLFRVSPDDFASVAQLASLRPRDNDRCDLLLSLLSDAERLTSYVNSLMYIDERRPHTLAIGTDHGYPATNRESSNDTVRSPLTTNNNGGHTTSGLAKTLVDFSVSLRTGLTRLSDCGLLENNDQANTQNRYADESNTVCPATSSVLTSGECKGNSDSVVAGVSGRYYTDYPECPLTTTCDDVVYTESSTAVVSERHVKTASLPSSETSGTSSGFDADIEGHLPSKEGYMNGEQT